MTTSLLAGRYELLELLGAGGMGSVWRGWDRREHRWVAVKVLSRYDAALLLRFVREQAVRIEHPHVAAPTGWVAEDERVALVMDLAAGGTLLDLLREHRRLPESLAGELLDQLLQGLGAVHRAGIVHRDLKPANLLLDATGPGRPCLRIGDFGVAATLDGPRFTLAPGTVGTPGYADPEQLRGAAPDPRHDLWSVGVIGVQLLTGLAPPEQPDSAPSGRLQPVLAALLADDPRDRPATAAAALTLLRRTGVVWRETDVRVPTRLPTTTRGATPGLGGRLVTWAAMACLTGSLWLSAATTWQALTG